MKNGSVFADVSGSPDAGLPDGMKIDSRGNVWATGPGGVWVFTPEGKHLGTIKLPEQPANCAWGDDWKTLFMTAETGLYRLKTSVAGQKTGVRMIVIHASSTSPSTPAKEQEMLRYFETVFRPAAQKFEGYLDVRMLKLRATLMGNAPAGVNYRFALVYKSEELRQKWIASDVHNTVWGGMEKTFLSRRLRRPVV